MEITCTRCHETVLTGNRYCSACGLPQLVYTPDAVSGKTQPAQWNEAVRDASTVDWKPALRLALMLAVPAGILSSGASEMGRFGLLWMAVAAAWAVVLYVRGQQAAWITIGAGARIGLVTGLLGGWLAFGASGGALFIERYLFHQSGQMDAEWKTYIIAGDQKVLQLVEGMGPEFVAQMQASQAQNQPWRLSPEGRAGSTAFSLASYSVFLVLFAVAGGALGARWMARSRRPEI
jgi:ribosomal protein L37E